MNYNKLLEEAFQNSSSGPGAKVRCLSTKFKPPKKDVRTKILSDNIKKFLQKQQEQEERERQEAEKRLQMIEQKKQEVRKLRKKESLTNNNVPNKKLSLIEEDTNNDDYGYTSQSASEFDRKFLEKFQNTERVRPDNARTKIDIKPKKAEKTSKSIAVSTTTSVSSNTEPKPDNKSVSKEKIDTKTIKITKNIPSQMSFQDLLKLAEKKQHEPIIIQKKIVEERRPMTEKELKRYQEEKESSKRREQKWKEADRDFYDKKKVTGSDSGSVRPKTNASAAVTAASTEKTKQPTTVKKPVSSTIKKPLVPPPQQQPSTATRKVPEKKLETRPLVPSTCRTTKLSPVRMPTKPFASAKPLSKTSTPIFTKQKRKQKVIYSDEEYDSEMDDFIVDDDCDVNVSDYIQKMFKYDRTKYNDDDDEDDRNMESSFGQQQREEMISTKIGLLEDLEDIKKEKEEKMRKEKFKRRF